MARKKKKKVGAILVAGVIFLALALTVFIILSPASITDRTIKRPKNTEGETNKCMLSTKTLGQTFNNPYFMIDEVYVKVVWAMGDWNKIQKLELYEVESIDSNRVRGTLIATTTNYEPTEAPAAYFWQGEQWLKFTFDRIQGVEKDKTYWIKIYSSDQVCLAYSMNNPYEDGFSTMDGVPMPNEDILFYVGGR